MKITVEIGSYTVENKDGETPCEVEIYFDKEGLDYLRRELSKLSDIGDHVHFMTPSWGMSDLCEDKLVDTNSLAHHLKLTVV